MPLTSNKMFAESGLCEGNAEAVAVRVKDFVVVE